MRSFIFRTFRTVYEFKRPKFPLPSYINSIILYNYSGNLFRLFLAMLPLVDESYVVPFSMELNLSRIQLALYSGY